jgi:hypothetical protein
LQIEVFALSPPGPRDDAGLQDGFVKGALARQKLAAITGAMLRQHRDWANVQPPGAPGSGCLLALLLAAVPALVLAARPLVRWITARRRSVADGSDTPP